MNKNLLAASIGAMLFGTAAQSQVHFEFPQTTNDAIVVASELRNNLALQPAPAQDGVDNLAWTIGYNFSPGEVRFGSLVCSSNVTLSNATTSVTDPDLMGPPPASDVTLGAINGQGTSTLFFSMTAASPLNDQITSNIRVVVDADVTLTNKSTVTCRFGIYDTPSQAQAGRPVGDVGTIFSTGNQEFILRANSYVFSATPALDTANVEAVPAYTRFVGPAPTDGVGDFNANVRLGLVAPTVPLNRQLLPISLSNLFFAGPAAPRTHATIVGDFSAALAGGAGVLLNGTAADARVGNTATFNFSGAIPSAGVSGPATYIPNTTSEIQISGYTTQFFPVFNADYELMQVHSPLNAGEINRNGTELVAPLAQVPGGWLARLVLNNTGSVARTFRVDLIPASSGSASEFASTYTGPTSVTGLTIAPGQTLVMAVGDLFPAANFSGPPRGTIRIRAEAPRGQMNGLYQIVNPGSGSISNHVMVQSGSN